MMNPLAEIVGATLLAAGLSVVLALAAARVARQLDCLIDHPNQRSLHSRPIPRVGGIGVMGAIALSSGWMSIGATPPLLIATVVLVAVSLLDDWRSQPVVLRLVVHLVAALIAINALLSLHWTNAIFVLLVVWAANLFNFMDGTDGLAAVMAICGFSVLGWQGVVEGHSLGPLCFLVAGAAAGFLLFNFPPARMFLGDAGSIPLGFLAAVVSIWGWRDGVWPGWFPSLVFLPFLLDATFTLLSRAARGERVWTAHREHLYQQLILAGWSSRRVLAVALIVIVSTSSLALFILHIPERFRVIAFLVTCLCLATIYAVSRWRLDRARD